MPVGWRCTTLTLKRHKKQLEKNVGVLDGWQRWISVAVATHNHCTLIRNVITYSNYNIDMSIDAGQALIVRRSEKL